MINYYNKFKEQQTTDTKYSDFKEVCDFCYKEGLMNATPFFYDEVYSEYNALKESSGSKNGVTKVLVNKFKVSRVTICAIINVFK